MRLHEQLAAAGDPSLELEVAGAPKHDPRLCVYCGHLALLASPACHAHDDLPELEEPALTVSEYAGLELIPGGAL